MKSRQDYLKNKCSHREYYNQFVNDNVKLRVKDRIGLDCIKESKNEAFNDIPLKKWDGCGLPYGIKGLLEKAGDYYTLAGQTCILKEAARQLKDEIN